MLGSESGSNLLEDWTHVEDALNSFFVAGKHWRTLNLSSRMELIIVLLDRRGDSGLDPAWPHLVSYEHRHLTDSQ